MRAHKPTSSAGHDHIKPFKPNHKQKILEGFKSAKTTEEKMILAQEFHSIKKDVSVHIHDYPNYPKGIELFADIVGYEGVYQIGNFGTIKAMERIFIKPSGQTNGEKSHAVYMPEAIKKVQSSCRNYLTIHLWKGGKIYPNLVHRLVAIHFIPNPHNLPVVCHSDDNRQNPHWSNLFWGTQLDNMADCIKKNRINKGEKLWNAVVNPTIVRELRFLFDCGLNRKQLSHLYGIKETLVKTIKSGKTWRHVQ